MKMTTEQYLSYLGIEVGKPFMVKDIECVIGYFDDRLVVYLKIIDEEQNFRELNWLLGKEITPLPKYTLTEDEKAIVRIKFEGDDVCIYRWGDETLAIQINNKDIAFIDYKLFPFVKVREEISLDELRKCV